MKRFFITLITALSVAGAAYATPIKFTDTTKFTNTGTAVAEDLVGYGGSSAKVLSEFGDYVAWKHAFTFAPAAARILEGTIKLTLVDDERDTLHWSSWEFALGVAEDGRWDIGAVNTGSYLYAVDVAALSDGVFGVTLASLGGDFIITQSDLTIVYEPIPEPSTIVLLMAGLLGIGYFARRRRTDA